MPGAVWALIFAAAFAGAASLAVNASREPAPTRAPRRHRTRPWSRVHQGGLGCSGDCVVPAGETWVLDQSVDVDTLTVRGTLVWDTTQDGLELRAGYVLVDDGGRLQIGTKEQPMDKQATIYIKDLNVSHDDLGTRFLGGVGSAIIEIHGRRLRRTWTLLAKTATEGESQLQLKDDPASMGWRVGDRIGVATTSRGNSTTHRIARIEAAPPAEGQCGDLGSVVTNCSADGCKVLASGLAGRTCASYCGGGGLGCLAAFAAAAGQGGCAAEAAQGCEQPLPSGDLVCHCAPPTNASAQGGGGGAVIHLEEPLRAEHWGGLRDVLGRRLELAAEVVNLERSVLITGERANFLSADRGLHTMLTGTGYMDVRFARVEYCGQRNVMGRYCLHFHLLGRCERCVFEGNAVVDSAQGGITVHGTHGSTVEGNVLWDTRAVGIYVEDGNEMNNTIRRNVVICSWWENCSVSWVQGQLYAGIFLIGMTNDLIENRVAGYENCLWTPGSAHGNGHGAALGKVCPMHLPFGEIRGNVNHDCHRFGLYLDSQLPRNVQRDENGFVTDLAGCDKFAADGTDNGLRPANEVHDELSWHNMFVGQYNLGDIRFINYTSVNNQHAMYWKSSKNFADGRLWHVEDALILNDPSDPIGALQFLGPGGPQVFGMRNVTFAGGPTVDGVLCAGHHCGLGGSGGPCVSQYLLEAVSFSEVIPNQLLLNFGVHATQPAEVLPIFLSKDGSLGDHRSLVSQHLDGFLQVAGCQREGPMWSNAIGCPEAVRRLDVWGPDAGDLQLAGPGYAVAPNDAPEVRGMNAGRMPYEGVNGKGYGVPVLAGQRYSLQGRFDGTFVVEFSDDVLAHYFEESDEQVDVAVGSSACTLRSSDDRRFIAPKGLVERVLPTHTRVENGTLRCAGQSRA